MKYLDTFAGIGGFALGNAVTVNVIEDIFMRIFESLKEVVNDNLD